APTGPAKSGPDWRDALAQLEADKAMSFAERRAKLAEVLDRNIDDLAAAAAVREKIRSALMSAVERVRLDREQTFADADKAALEGRYGDALRVWQSWIGRVQVIAPDDDLAIAQ